ncbi:hypothetical protein [Ramlibacter sp.]|uniref:hypothetical protein n=1 Tax=Ramlibacter sp. TaxID=1917967 RepID=UPI002FC8EB3A
MNGAPSVSYPVGRSAWLGLLLALAWVAGVLAWAAWAGQGASPARLALGALATAAAGAWAARWWWRLPGGLLEWDGGGWRFSPAGAAPGAAGQVEPVLDAQSALLLRWRAQAGRGAWLWAERSRRPARWDALRRAVYSRASADAPPRAEPPSARP